MDKRKTVCNPIAHLIPALSVPVRGNRGLDSPLLQNAICFHAHAGVERPFPPFDILHG